MFIKHGLPKIKAPFGMAEMLAGMGFKPAKFWSFVVAFAEFFGGIALIIGFASRVAAAILFLQFVVILGIKMTKWKMGYIEKEKPGLEYDLVLLAAFLTLFLLGSGNYSIDQLIGWALG